MTPHDGALVDNVTDLDVVTGDGRLVTCSPEGESELFALWLFRSVKAGDDAALSALLASNRDLLSKMTAVGGKRYAPYSMVISPAEWQTH